MHGNDRTDIATGLLRASLGVMFIAHAMLKYLVFTLREAGLPFDLERVDLATHRLATGADFATINGKRSVPVLELDDGQRLTEGPAPGTP